MSFREVVPSPAEETGVAKLQNVPKNRLPTGKRVVRSAGQDRLCDRSIPKGCALSHKSRRRDARWTGKQIAKEAGVSPTHRGG
jgi:hypothetical protein